MTTLARDVRRVERVGYTRRMHDPIKRGGSMQAGRTVIAAAFIVLMVAGAGAQSGYDLFQQALMKERAEQNLTEAIRLYERIVSDFKSNRPLVARTLVQLGSAFEKEKDTQRARAAY